MYLFRIRLACTHLEHVELLRRVVMRSALGLLHPVQRSLHVLHEKAQAVELLLRATLRIGASGKLLEKKKTRGDTVIHEREFLDEQP